MFSTECLLRDVTTVHYNKITKPATVTSIPSPKRPTEAAAPLNGTTLGVAAGPTLSVAFGAGDPLAPPTDGTTVKEL
jgi:hypothetical protein